MPTYVDTSALVKRSVAEVGSTWVRRLLAHPAQYVIYTAALSQVEVISALQRRVREGYTWVIDATRLLGMDDHPWLYVVHRSVRETAERVRRLRAMRGGRARGGKASPVPPRQASGHGAARRDDRNPDQTWRAVVSGAPDRRGPCAQHGHAAPPCVLRAPVLSL